MISWNDHAKYRISPPVPSELRHDDIVRHTTVLLDQFSDRLSTRTLGHSVEGRSITLITLGQGTKTVLAWSQMHGNEPTHTAAMLDLTSFLLSDPSEPTAAKILAECQLQLVLMLNPDGAQRWTRRNAQDIDINRDALHLQTPEGRILHNVVKELQPDFALNLHNHRPHTTVGATQQPASFSLLVPPIDASETDTQGVLQAKRLAGRLVQALQSHSPAPLSRYDADFMPRCFGEWVQQQGAATITIEAGGWSTVVAEPLVQLHFYGLVACLESIANEDFVDVDPAIYEHLPRTGEHDLFDQLIRGVTIVNGLGQQPFRSDLGLNFRQTVPATGEGHIVDLGDLHVTTGKSVTDGANLVCLPGRFAWNGDVTPSSLPDRATAEQLLARGVTTLIGQVDLAEYDVAALEAVAQSYDLAINLGFVAKLSKPTSDYLERLVAALSHGVLAVLSDGLLSEAKLYLSMLDYPIVS
ncbi:MAG: M14 family zinc carboxypeptidase, partial [Planctomycetota bacterium]